MQGRDTDNPWDDGVMPDRLRKRPGDLNPLAAAIVGEATGETPAEPEATVKTRLWPRAAKAG